MSPCTGGYQPRTKVSFRSLSTGVRSAVTRIIARFYARFYAIYRPFRDDSPTYWDELYEADFGSDWFYGENLKSRPPSTPVLTHDAAADTIVPYTDRQLI